MKIFSFTVISCMIVTLSIANPAGNVCNSFRPGLSQEFALLVHPGAREASYTKAQPFKVIAFFKGLHDQAHVSFVKEANAWFSAGAAAGGFSYDTTSRWDNLNDSFLSRYTVVLFLDARPEEAAQRAAFRRYMEEGGGWIGFHFAAFALTPSDYPQDWDWYHNEFLGSGSYVSNTWRPTSAVLDVAKGTSPVKSDTIHSAPNEWYRWENDLRKNKNIRIIASINPLSFPLGTGPKPHEIWHEGYYPVAWSNLNYQMVYFNMGHNDIDYEGGTNKTLSLTFSSPSQAALIMQTLVNLGNGRPLH